MFVNKKRARKKHNNNYFNNITFIILLPTILKHATKFWVHFFTIFHTYINLLRVSHVNLWKNHISQRLLGVIRMKRAAADEKKCHQKKIK